MYSVDQSNRYSNEINVSELRFRQAKFISFKIVIVLVCNCICDKRDVSSIGNFTQGVNTL